MVRKIIASITGTFCLMAFTFSMAESSGLSVPETTLKEHQIPAFKRVMAGNYLTSVEAYKYLGENEDVLFIDVRDSMEIGVFGHPIMLDAIVPLQIQTTKFDEVLREYKLADNAEFLSEMAIVFEMHSKSKSDMVILTCGSGQRSAKAANKLTEAGYTNVWHIPDGYVGDEKPGMNKTNAWKLAGLPWSKDLIHGSEWRLKIVE